MIKTNNRLFTFLLFLISSITAFIIPLVRFSGYCTTRDWGLFNSLSLFSKSSWLHYHRLPIHNPYVLGGMDNLANPQTKVFSPLAIFDLLFAAPYANLLSLFTLSIIGAYGMFHLMQYLKLSKVVAFIIAIIFIHGSWFHLHFAEGHIIFGGFLLFGWVVLCAIRLTETKYKFILALILAFFFLDGGIYAFIYAVLLIFSILLFQVNGVSFKKVVKSVIEKPIDALLSKLVFVGLASFKLIPLLVFQLDRKPVLENIHLNLKTVMSAFFNPNAHICMTMDGTNFKEHVNYHEVGAYVGVLTAVLVVYLLVRSRMKGYWSYFFIIILFGWVGTGWFDPFNPWRLFQQLPVINNAHIQTRAFFVVFCFTLILLAFALELIRNTKPKLALILGVFLVLESLVVSNWPYYKTYTYTGSLVDYNLMPKLITNTRVDTTFSTPNSFGWGYDFEHYNRSNACTKSFMDPSTKPTQVKSFDEVGYKGEVYLLSGNGHVTQKSFIPGELILNCNLQGQSIIQCNTNYLSSWSSNNPAVKVYEKDGLLTLSTPQGVYQLTLSYTPTYFVYCCVLSLIGIISSLLLLKRIRQTNSKNSATA